MRNLATALGHSVIYKQENSSGSYFYKVANASFSQFQSASNTILELSRKLIEKSHS